MGVLPKRTRGWWLRRQRRLISAVLLPAVWLCMGCPEDGDTIVHGVATVNVRNRASTFISVEGCGWSALPAYGVVEVDSGDSAQVSVSAYEGSGDAKQYRVRWGIRKGDTDTVYVGQADVEQGDTVEQVITDTLWAEHSGVAVYPQRVGER